MSKYNSIPSLSQALAFDVTIFESITFTPRYKYVSSQSTPKLSVLFLVPLAILVIVLFKSHTPSFKLPSITGSTSVFFATIILGLGDAVTILCEVNEPSTVLTVIVAVPTAKVDTIPLDDIEAINGSELSHVTFLFEAFAGTTAAINCVELPTIVLIAGIETPVTFIILTVHSVESINLPSND